MIRLMILSIHSKQTMNDNSVKITFFTVYFCLSDLKKINLSTLKLKISEETEKKINKWLFKNSQKEEEMPDEIMHALFSLDFFSLLNC